MEFDVFRPVSYTHLDVYKRQAVDTSIHAEYTSNPRLVAEMAEYTKAMNARCHIHLSETKAEQEACLSRHGKTPAQYFNDLGVFDSPTTAAHCVWLTEQDVALLAKKNVTVASCPVSNLKPVSYTHLDVYKRQLLR